ncbi:MAG: TetR/AcrR family transcriptional regulator [Coriobacteriales bacterium]|jgi:AcrR family transcriptional regulator
MARVDIRNIRTEQAIESALLEVLAEKPISEIGVSEVAQRAGISRSTFYAHFNNLDEVVDRLMERFCSRTSTLTEQLACAGCEHPAGREPFCRQIRDAGEFDALVGDPQFLSRALDMFIDLGNDTTARSLEHSGVPADIAAAISRFQVCGCYTVATNLDRDVDWSRIQEALDTFIAAGLEAVEARYRS